MELQVPLNVSTEWGLPILAVLVSMVGLLSSSEAALLSVSWLRIKHLIEKKDKRAIIVEQILEKKDKLLSTILFTENLCIILSTSLATVIALQIFGEENKIVVSSITTGIMTLVILIFGEITPKTLAANYAEPFALAVAKPISYLMKICTLIVMFFSILPSIILKIAGKTKLGKDVPSPEELSTIINISEKHGELEAEEGELLRNILELAESKAGDVMVPRTKIIGLDITATREDIIKVFQESYYSRFPVFEGSLDQIVGFLDIRDILPILAKGEKTLYIREHIKQPVFVPESRRIGKLLTSMKEERFQIAVVLDEYGGTAGLVTLTDLIEEIVGELETRLHVAKEHLLLENKSTIVTAETKLEEVEEWLGISLPESDYTTVGGLVFTLIGREPVVGESVENSNIRFTVTEKNGYKISKIMITKR